MGRKAGNLYINPKKFGSMAKPCMKEMIAFMNCLALNNINDDKCDKQKQLLSVCMHGQVHHLHFALRLYFYLFGFCFTCLRLP